MGTEITCNYCSGTGSDLYGEMCQSCNGEGYLITAYVDDVEDDTRVFPVSEDGTPICYLGETIEFHKDINKVVHTKYNKDGSIKEKTYHDPINNK